MPRYYFHIRDGSSFRPDEEGVELAGPEDIRREAREAARAFARDTEGNADGQSFEVSDASGQLVLVYPFKEAFST